MYWYWKSRYYGGKWWALHWHVRWCYPEVGVSMGTGMWYWRLTLNLVFVGGFLRLGWKKPDYPGSVDISE